MMMNNYGFNYPQPNYDRVDAQIRQLQELRQQMGQQPMPPQPMPNVAMSNRGTYVYVNDYQDVVNYPTPADGNAVLFFNLDKGILWSKKFVNGSNSIQAFTIAPLNNVGGDTTNTTTNDEKPLNMAKNNEITENMLDRITSLEDKFDKLLETMKNSNRIIKPKE